MVDSHGMEAEGPAIAGTAPVVAPPATTGLGSRLNLFDSQRKLRFLELAKVYWPDLSRLAEAVGVSRQTVWNHRKSDPAFNKALHDLDQAICDELELTLVNNGKQPKGFLDRISYLRAHRPELYDRAKVVRVEGYKMSDADKSRRLEVVSQAVDAEIVKSGVDRKTQRRLAGK